MTLFYIRFKKKIVDFIVRNYAITSNKILSLYENTLFQKLLIWIKRNQKLSAFLTSLLMTFQVFVIRYKKEQVQEINLVLEKENSSLKSAIMNKNSVMDEFPYPWWKKQMSGGFFIFIDLNDSYEEDLKIDKLFVLGKNNFQIVPEESAQAYHDNDSILAARLTDTLIIEPFEFKDKKKIKLLVWKGARRENLDTILEGFAIPLNKVLKVIENDKNKKN